MMNITKFADELTKNAVEYRQEPFILRNGEKSNWYIDHRRGLSSYRMLESAGKLIVAQAKLYEVDYAVVAGGGVGGRGLAIATAGLSDKKWSIANLDINDNTDAQNGFGLHGAKVENQEVLIVDDIGSTGSSLIELTDMVRKNGGIVEHAINVSDRSQGLVSTAMSEIGVAYHALLDFDESTGRLVPRR